MNSTADSTPSLPEGALESLYQEAAVYNYSSGEELDKNTILASLQTKAKHYEQLSLIDKGGSKEIFEVKDTRTSRCVAMAVLQDPENIHFIEDFLREARLTALLQHPNIMPIYDIGLNEDGHPFFTMKLLKAGQNLSSLIARMAATPNRLELFPLHERLELFLKLCNAVSYAHSLGVLHLDIKPSNILLGDFGEVLLSDWGLARLTDQAYAFDELSAHAEISALNFINLTLNGMIKGTPGYMAPEQAQEQRREKDERTDIYSLGAVLYKLLAFDDPIQGDDLQTILRKTREGELTPLETYAKEQSIPEALVKVVERSMSLNASERYQTVNDLEKDIRAYLNGFATTAEDAGFLRLATLFYQRNRAKCQLITAALLSIVLITSLMMFQLRKSEQAAVLYAEQANEAKKEALSFAEQANTAKQEALSSAKRVSETEEKLYDSLKNLEKEKEAKVYFAKISALVNWRDGYNLYQDSQYLKAIKKFREVNEYSPDIWRSWSDLACVYMSGQRFALARDNYQKALNCQPNDFEKTRLRNLIKLCQKYDALLVNRRLEESHLDDLFKVLNGHGYTNIARHMALRREKNIYYTDRELGL